MLLDTVVPRTLQSALRGGTYPNVYIFLPPGTIIRSMLHAAGSSVDFAFSKDIRKILHTFYNGGL